MAEAPQSSLPAPNGARCARHPDRPASASCARCGGFVCTGDEVRLAERVYCGPCAAHPDVDYLEAFRLQRWGRRTPGAWVIGVPAMLVGAIALWMTVDGILEGNRSLITGGPLIFSAAAGGLAFFFRLRWSRIAVFAFPLIPCALAAADRDYHWVKILLAAAGLGTMLVLDPRTRLFFRLECSRRQLRRAWHRHADNRMALVGFRLAGAAVLLLLAVRFAAWDGSWKVLALPMAIAAVPLSIIGLRRSAPRAYPPVGRRGQAIAGIVLATLALVGWLTLLRR